MKVRLTDTAVKAAAVRPVTYVIRDTEVRGFGLRITKNGSKAFVLNYTHRGRKFRLTLGRVDEGALAGAMRAVALRMVGEVARGVDPGVAARASAAIPTIAEFGERYLEQYAWRYKARASAREDQRLLGKEIVPRIGQLRLDAVTRADVENVHAAMSSHPFAANRTRALLSRLFNLAFDWGVLPEGRNPVLRTRRYEERGRERFLTDEELGRLGGALAAAEASGERPAGIAAIRLLALTGMRKSEVLRLRWEELDLARGFATLPRSKTGKKIVPLGPEAVALLEQVPRWDYTEFVFPSRRAGVPSDQALWKVWNRVRTAAGLRDVRLHDLRHTWASDAVGAGVPIYTVGKALGHRKSSTTERYAHLANDPLREAVAGTSGRIAGAMGITHTPAPTRRTQEGT